MITRTRFVLAVRNLDASVHFYREMLGMSVDLEVPGWCFLSREHFAIALGENPDSMAPADLGDHAYFAYVVTSDATSLFQEFSARSADFIKPLTNEPWGMKEFGLRTIDGHRIMFAQEFAGNDNWS